jgi:ribonucleoside-diphosphate reductase alpha chain
LSSLNLSEFVVNPYTPTAHLNTEDFLHAIDVGIRTLDKLIDENYNRHPLQQQRDMSYNYRNIGLGIFGYATALMKLGLKYGSNEAIEFTDDVFSLLFKRAVFASNNLAKELGTYPKYKECVFDSDIIKNHFTPDEIDGLKEHGLRNCSLISIAPNGSLATLLGESGGCEPEFALKYTRRTVGMTDGEDTYYDVYCKAAKEYMDANHTDILPDYFVGSADIPWQNRVLTQAAMQNHVDTAISSTVNMPNSATKEDVAHMYLLAWSTGCKGITMFRDGCKRLGILTTDKSESGTDENGIKPYELPRGAIIECSSDLVGKKRKLTTGCGSLHVLAFFDPYDGSLQEAYFNKGSTGGCANFMTGLSRTVSLLCRAGVDIMTIKDQLDSTGACPSYAARTATRHDTSKGSCCPMAIGNALVEMYNEMQQDIGDNEEEINTDTVVHQITKPEQINSNDRCPECGSILEHVGGCDLCKNCGFTHCG